MPKSRTSYERDATGDEPMTIEFTPDESYEHHRRSVVWFNAVDDEKVISCAISLEALNEHFGAYADDPLPAFRKHRQEIWDLAAKLINQRRFEADGTILIQSADIKPPQSGATTPPKQAR
jgi:hypothetical protein